MTRVIFASCIAANIDNAQDVWKEAKAHQPDWLILCGDNIYMDYGLSMYAPRRWSLRKFAQEMQERYAEQFSVESFRELVSSIPAGQVAGVWDDHDFAWNNCCGADTKYKMQEKGRIARALYHHFFDAINQRPLPDALPKLEIEGLDNHPSGLKDIYRAFNLGPFRVLLCDGRSYREGQSTGEANRQLLGKEQEAWLLNELKGSGPFLLVSGSTMTAGDDQSWDYYKDFFRNRFLPATKDKVVLFLGGDVHENRLPQKVEGRPVEAASSAAALGFPLQKRNFGVLDFKEDRVDVFLYKHGKIEIFGEFELTTGRLVTSMSLLELMVPITPADALAQREEAVTQLRYLR